MSKTRKEQLDFSLMLENHSQTDCVFLHWLTLAFDRIELLILSSIVLLTKPRSLFAGLINLHFGLFSTKSLTKTMSKLVTVALATCVT